MKLPLPLSIAMWSFLVTASNTRRLTPKVVPPKQLVDGKTHQEWAAEWARWYSKLPATDQHPVNDLSGEFCDQGQDDPDIPVFFFVGGYSVASDGTCCDPFTRNMCSVPDDKYILFPILITGCSTVEDPDFGFHLTLPTCELPEGNELICAKKWADGPVGHFGSFFAKVDGFTLSPERLKIGPMTLDFTIPDDNVFGADCTADDVNCDEVTGIWDGYWIFLKPLQPSPEGHTIQFGGEITCGELGFCVCGDEGVSAFFLDVTYEL